MSYSREKYVYEAQVQKKLEGFKSTKEWTDLIAHLTGLEKVFSSVQFDYVPCKYLLFQRLCMCLNATLPPGVHRKTLSIYMILYKKIRPEYLDEDFGLYTMGVFSFYHSASIRAKEEYLELIEKTILVHAHIVRKYAEQIVYGIVPGIEENNEFSAKARVLLDHIKNTVSPAHFSHIVWRLSIEVPNARHSIITYVRDILDVEELVIEENSVVIAQALVVGLEDGYEDTLRRIIDITRIFYTKLKTVAEEQHKKVIERVLRLIVTKDALIRKKIIALVEIIMEYARDTPGILVDPLCKLVRSRNVRDTEAFLHVMRILVDGNQEHCFVKHLVPVLYEGCLVHDEEFAAQLKQIFAGVREPEALEIIAFFRETESYEDVVKLVLQCTRCVSYRAVVALIVRVCQNFDPRAQRQSGIGNMQFLIARLGEAIDESREEICRDVHTYLCYTQLCFAYIVMFFNAVANDEQKIELVQHALHYYAVTKNPCISMCAFWTSAAYLAERRKKHKMLTWIIRIARARMGLGDMRNILKFLAKNVRDQRGARLFWKTADLFADDYVRHVESRTLPGSARYMQFVYGIVYSVKARREQIVYLLIQTAGGTREIGFLYMYVQKALGAPAADVSKTTFALLRNITNYAPFFAEFVSRVFVWENYIYKKEDRIMSVAHVELVPYLEFLHTAMSATDSIFAAMNTVFADSGLLQKIRKRTRLCIDHTDEVVYTKTVVFWIVVVELFKAEESTDTATRLVACDIVRHFVQKHIVERETVLSVSRETLLETLRGAVVSGEMRTLDMLLEIVNVFLEHDAFSDEEMQILVETSKKMLSSVNSTMYRYTWIAFLSKLDKYYVTEIAEHVFRDISTQYAKTCRHCALDIVTFLKDFYLSVAFIVNREKIDNIVLRLLETLLVLSEHTKCFEPEVVEIVGQIVSHLQTNFLGIYLESLYQLWREHGTLRRLRRVVHPFDDIVEKIVVYTAEKGTKLYMFDLIEAERAEISPDVLHDVVFQYRSKIMSLISNVKVSKKTSVLRFPFVPCRTPAERDSMLQIVTKLGEIFLSRVKIQTSSDTEISYITFLSDYTLYTHFAGLVNEKISAVIQSSFHIVTNNSKYKNVRRHGKYNRQIANMILATIENPHLQKMWKKEILTLFANTQFFEKMTRATSEYRKIIERVFTEKDVYLEDLVANLSFSLYLDKVYERRKKKETLRKIALVIFSCPDNQFSAVLHRIFEEIISLTTSGDVPYIEVLFVCRVVVLKNSNEHLSDFMPHIVVFVLGIVLQFLRQTDSVDPNVILSVLKFSYLLYTKSGNDVFEYKTVLGCGWNRRGIHVASEFSLLYAKLAEIAHGSQLYADRRGNFLQKLRVASLEELALEAALETQTEEQPELLLAREFHNK